MRHTTPGPILSSTMLAPERHSFFRYPTVPIRPLGSLSSSQPSTFDTVLRWGFWMGVGFAAVQVFQKLTQKSALEGNHGRTTETEKIRADAINMYIPGEPVGPIATELGVCLKTLKSWLKEAGVYVPAPEGKPPFSKELRQKVFSQYVPGEPVPPLAKEIGVSPGTIVRWMKEAGVYVAAPTWLPRDEQLYEEALRQYVPGDPVSPLARELGVSVPTVINWLKEAGVYEPASRGRPRGRKKKK